MALAGLTGTAAAQDATWLANPGTGDFNTDANWNPANTPGSGDTAFFGTSDTTTIGFSVPTTIVGGWTFNAGADDYTIDSYNVNSIPLSVYQLVFDGAGIVVNGGSVTINHGDPLPGRAAVLRFTNSSTAGAATINNSAEVEFHDSSNAGTATIVNDQSLLFLDSSSAGSSHLTNNDNAIFGDQSSAGDSTIINNDSLQFHGSSTAGTANIQNNSTLLFIHTASADSAEITNANGAQVLFWHDSTAGNATIVNDGNVEFRENATGGSATITNDDRIEFFADSTAGNATITNNFDMNFNNSSTAGNATITTTNGGTTEFLDTSSGGQARFITESGGTFDISGLTSAGTTAGSIEGAGDYVLGGKSLTVGSNNLSTEVSGVIGGAGGSLVKTGAGTLTLSGNNTYTGDTTITGGTLAIVDSDALGSGTVRLEGGTLRALGSTTITRSFTVTAGQEGGIVAETGQNLRLAVGPGQFTHGHGSTLRFGDANGGEGTVELNLGTISLGSPGANIFIDAGVVRVFNGVSAGTFFRGNGAQLHLNRGAALNIHTNTGTSGTQIENLQDGADGGGTIFHAGANARLLTLDNTRDTSFSGVIDEGAGTITVRKLGANALTLSGDNNFSGGVNFDQGTLSVGHDNALGSGTLTVQGSTLDIRNGITVSNFTDLRTTLDMNVGAGANGTHAGTIGETGGPHGINKTGTGTLTLSGVNTYTGMTTVNAGRLVVDGSIESSSGVTVNSGGTVGGTGRLTSTVIDGGTFAPGNSIGTLTVAGDLTVRSGSTFEVEASPAAADLARVTGRARLGGRVHAIFQPGSYSAKRYKILTANGGVKGKFDSVETSNLPSFFNVALSYTANNVFLKLQSALSSFLGLTQNQRSVGAALDAAYNGGTPFVGQFARLLNVDQASMPLALDQLSGEVATGAARASFRSGELFLSMMLDPFAPGRGGNTNAPVLAFAAAPGSEAFSGNGDRWTVWGGAYGGRAAHDGSSTIGSHDHAGTAGGFAAGADRRFRSALGEGVYGFALTAGTASFNLGGGLGSGDSEFAKLGGYASLRSGPAYLSGALSYGVHRASHERTVRVAGADTFEGGYTGREFGLRGEAGYRLSGPLGSVTPYAALNAIWFRAPGYAERAAAGSPDLALAFGGKTHESVRSELGAWFDHGEVFGGAYPVTLRTRAAWVHDYSGAPAIGAGFRGLPGTSFTVIGATGAEDAALISAAADVALGSATILTAKFDGEFAGDARSYAGTLNLRHGW